MPSKPLATPPASNNLGPPSKTSPFCSSSPELMPPIGCQQFQFYSDEEELNFEKADQEKELSPFQNDKDLWPPLPTPLFDKKTVKKFIESAKMKNSRLDRQRTRSSSGVSSAATDESDFNANSLDCDKDYESLNVAIDTRNLRDIQNSIIGIRGGIRNSSNVDQEEGSSFEAHDTTDTAFDPVEASKDDEGKIGKHYCENEKEREQTSSSQDERVDLRGCPSNSTVIEMDSDLEEPKINSQDFVVGQGSNRIHRNSISQTPELRPMSDASDNEHNADNSPENDDDEESFSDLDHLIDDVQNIDDLIDKYEKLCSRGKSVKQKQRLSRKKQNVHLLKNHRKYHQTSSSSSAESLMLENEPKTDFKQNVFANDDDDGRSSESDKTASEPPAKRRSKNDGEDTSAAIKAFQAVHGPDAQLNGGFGKGGYGQWVPPGARKLVVTSGK